jgi:hypothetical protein
MKSVEVQIKGKTFKLGFGLEVFVQLGIIWNIDTLDEVNAKFVEFVTIDPTKSLSLSVIVKLSEIIEAVIAANPENTEKVTAVEIRSLQMNEFEALLSSFMNAFSESIPKETDKGKKQLAPKK